VRVAISAASRDGGLVWVVAVAAWSRLAFWISGDGDGEELR
jgi:hypothetical protein